MTWMSVKSWPLKLKQNQISGQTQINWNGFEHLFTPELDCPTCREPFGEGKSLLAFAVAEQVQHECSHPGCTKTTPLGRIVHHERECKWRLVMCPGDGGSCTEMIPFCKVEAHAQGCKGCEWPLECFTKDTLQKNKNPKPASTVPRTIISKMRARPLRRGALFIL